MRSLCLAALTLLGALLLESDPVAAQPAPSRQAAPKPAPAAPRPTPAARRRPAAPKPNPADAAFMAGMMHHHAQALVMSRMAPTHDASDAVQRLAARIINAQQDDIALMTQWLKERGLPVPDVNDASGTGGHAMHDMPGMSHGATMMPGMLSPEQLQRLDAARGVEFDRLFLAGMIQHHQGATVMVKELITHDGAAQDRTVFKFAADVNVDQTTEIERMRLLLADVLIEKRGP